jgi:hypothetical protein
VTGDDIIFNGGREITGCGSDAVIEGGFKRL